jgi:hypothetical protein
MTLVIAHSSLHWLEPALFAVPTLAVLGAIVRDRVRRRSACTKEFHD